MIRLPPRSTRLTHSFPTRRSSDLALIAQQEDGRHYPVTWTTLGGYLDHLAARGIAPNVASYVGAAPVREMVLGDAATDPPPAPVQAMQGIVRQAMDYGAMGVAYEIGGTTCREGECKSVSSSW